MELPSTFIEQQLLLAYNLGIQSRLNQTLVHELAQQQDLSNKLVVEGVRTLTLALKDVVLAILPKYPRFIKSLNKRVRVGSKRLFLSRLQFVYLSQGYEVRGTKQREFSALDPQNPILTELFSLKKVSKSGDTRSPTSFTFRYNWDKERLTVRVFGCWISKQGVPIPYNAVGRRAPKGLCPLARDPTPRPAAATRAPEPVPSAPRFRALQ